MQFEKSSTHHLLSVLESHRLLSAAIPDPKRWNGESQDGLTS